MSPSDFCIACVLLMPLIREVLPGTSSGGGDCEGSFFNACLITLSITRADSSPPTFEIDWKNIPVR